jgi:hypothetical protein
MISIIVLRADPQTAPQEVLWSVPWGVSWGLPRGAPRGVPQEGHRWKTNQQYLTFVSVSLRLLAWNGRLGLVIDYFLLVWRFLVSIFFSKALAITPLVNMYQLGGGTYCTRPGLVH